MVFAKHLKSGRDIESIKLLFFIHKKLKEINETPMGYSRGRRECVLPGKGYFCGIMNE